MVTLVLMSDDLNLDYDNNLKSRSARNRDHNELAYLGKKQVLQRNFGFMSILGFICISMNTWEGTLSWFALSLQNGGPAGLIYGYVIF